MYLLYIDESGTADLKKNSTPSPSGNNTLYFTLGAALIHVRELEKIEVQFSEIKEKFFKDPYDEIKYSIKSEKLKTGLSVKDFRNDVYTCISNSATTIFGVQQNKFFCYEQGLVTSKDDTYLMSFQHLLSIVNSHVFRRKITDPIITFIDTINNTHDLKVYKAYQTALENESIFKNFDKKKFSPTINFVNSKFTCGLQVADLISGAFWRGLEIDDKKFATKIKNRIPCSDDGNPIGYGYKICADWLILNK